MKNDDDNDGKSCIELDFKNTKKEAIYENNEQTTGQLDDEFNIINKRLINIIMNKMKNKEMYLTKLITKLHEMRGIARQNLIADKEKSKSQEDIYKAKTLGNLNHIRILKDSTIKYELEEPEFLSHKDCNIDKRIIFIS